MAGALGAGQDDPYERLRTVQEAAAQKQRDALATVYEPAIQKQRESVRRQVPVKAPPVGDSFFTVPFSFAVSPGTAGGSSYSDCDAMDEQDLRAAIEEAARREGLTPDLLRAMIGKESAFRPCAVSQRGAQGLMQLMPATQAQLGVTDPFDPQQNIAAGAKLMKTLLERYTGDLALALGAYNAGPGKVDRFGGIPAYPETIDYVSDIMGKLGSK